MSEATSGAADAAPEVLVHHIALALRLAQVHAVENHAFDAPLAALARVLARATADTVLVSMADTVFVNGVLVRLRGAEADSVALLKRALDRVDVQELTIERGTSEPELRAFLAEYQRAYRSQTPAQAATQISGKVRLRNVSGAMTSGPAFAIDARQNVLRTFARLAVGADEALQALARGEAYRSTNLRRAVQSLADSAVGHEALLAGITRFPAFRGQLHYHLASVAALTLLMAMRLSLPKAALADVALAALLHDVGRAGEGGDSPAQVRALLRLSEQISPESMVQAAAAFEAGLPLHASKVWNPGALGRLIAVPCCFDTLTAGGGGAERPLQADQALRVIQEQAGARFDPLVVRLFVQTVGLYPVGTTVRLSTGQLAVVLEVPADAAHFTRPRVKVVRDHDGPADYVIDLAADPGGVGIVASVDPGDQNLNPQHYLLS